MGEGEREGQKSLKDLKHSRSREDRRERPDPEVMGLMEFQELMKGGSATFEAMEVKCRGRMRKERERRLDQRVIIKRGDVTKFHGIGLSVEETQDAESNYQHSAEGRGSMLHRQQSSVRPGRMHELER